MPTSFLCEENFAKLDKVIEKYEGVDGALMLVLQEAQEVFGCLPIEVQKEIAEKLDMPLAEVYGVVTFYSQFRLTPTGEYTIAVCMGTACYVRGAQKLIDLIVEDIGIQVGETSADGMFTLEATRCIGACGLAPVLTVNEDVYGRLEESDIKDILAKYKK
ncbi:MAG: NAD(P)H-dependent oxidoreductase subunit E [Clostridia bacterium]|nr:NAD(P)H-dependent oxidoreductase subunit E [Clostridia bacterium]